jgi:formylglycine-generating enzyme required for sulfatase activity
VALYEELMEKAPEDRPDSAQQLVEELEVILEEGAVPRWEHGAEVAVPTGDSQLETMVAGLPSSAGPQTGQSVGGKRLVSTAHERKRLRERAGKRKRYLLIGGVVLLIGGVLAVLLSNLGGRKDMPETAPPSTIPSAGESAPGLLISPAAAAKLQEMQAGKRGLPVEVSNSLGMVLRYVPAARFRRGTTDEQIEWALQQVTAEGLLDRYGDYILSEKPATLVNIPRPFYLGATEVTVGQFRSFVEESGYKTTAESDGRGGIAFESGEYGAEFHWDNPGFPQGEENPVINITQGDALAFCDWLSEKEGKDYTLPSDDQWEFAARAGSGGRWCFGDDPSGFYDYGLCYNNSPNSTQPVAKLRPNSYGLHDMHGNAREWVLLNDGSAANEVGTGIVRGGSFTKPPVLCRSASRVGFKVSGPYPYHSFRVLLQLDEGAARKERTGPRERGGLRGREKRDGKREAGE